MTRSVPADNKFKLDELMEAEAHLLGRVTYEGFAEAWPSREGEFAERLNRDPKHVAFDEQNRSLWDRQRINEGLQMLDAALRLRRTGTYQLQAAIAALHLQGGDAGDTDWKQIAELFEALAEISPSLIVEINRAVAVGFAFGAGAGLEVLEPLLGESSIRDYQPLHAAHAELLLRSRDVGAAQHAYERAIALSTNAVERGELQRRLLALTRTPPSPTSQ